MQLVAGVSDEEADATVETVRTLRTCYSVFRREGDPRADEVLAAACEQLERRASTIDEADHIARFWALADHRFFQEIATEDDLP